ncbi:hypothetical protein B0H21DRAFT_760543 [Amylocystis lapponica]|nr:hypothetical protein B0H21DRAFT_760543 [Amylocystis lapponica]
MGRMKLKLSYHDRTQVGITRMGSGSFTLEDAKKQVRRDAVLTKSPLGPRKSAYIEQAVKKLAFEGQLVVNENKRLKSSPAARRIHREIDKKLEGATFASPAEKYYAKSSYVRAKFGPSHKLSKRMLLDELEDTRNANKALRRRLGEGSSTDVMQHSMHADAVVETADGAGYDNEVDNRDPFVSPERPTRVHSGTIDPERAYPSPTSMPRRPVSRMPTEFFGPSSPSPRAASDDTMEMDAPLGGSGSGLSAASSLRALSRNVSEMLREDKSGKAATLAEVRTQLAREQENIAALRRCLRGQSRLLTEDDDDISGLIDEVYAVRQLLQDALGREDALRTQIGTLGHTLSARNAAHEALQATLSETAAALDQCKDTIRELQRQIEVKDAALERLLAHKDAVQALANAVCGPLVVDVRLLMLL